MSRIKAIIFDFDGTILDTETPDFITWQEVYQAHGAKLSMDVWADLVGTSPEAVDLYSKLEQLSGHEIERDELDEKRRKRQAVLIQQQKILPGVELMINYAVQTSIKLGIASTSDCSWVEGHLERLGLKQHFPVIRCAEWVEHVKPAPDLYLSALDGLGVSASEAIALEDSPHGVLAAKRAGIFTIAIPNEVTKPLDLSHADMLLNALDELHPRNLLLKINGNLKKSG